MAKYEKKTIDVVIDGKKYVFESSTHFKESTKVLFKQLIQGIKEWKKNPTQENWIKIFRTIKSKLPGKPTQYRQLGFSGDLRTFLQGGKDINQAAKDIFKQSNIKKLLNLSADDVNKIKTYTPQSFMRAAARQGSIKAALRTPEMKLTYDYPEIIKIFDKYKYNTGISKFKNQDAIIAQLKNHPTIIRRFKEAGVPLTLKNLKTRIARTHNAIIRNSIDSTRYAGIFEGLSLADRQNFLNMAVRTFDNTVFPSFEGHLVQMLKGNELKLATDKLQKFTYLKNFLANKLKHVGGKHGSFIQMDHPISLAHLEKSKNLHQALRVNPIAGDINKWKRSLDQRLNTLQKKGDVKGLRALREINQTLFGKGSPSFTVGAKGISELTGLPADFRKANLVKLLKENVGLHETLKENIKTIPEQTWKASGANQAGIIQRLNQLKSWDPEVLTRYINEWTDKNPKWTKILEKRIGCKSGCLAVAANENPARFSEILKKTPQAARSFLGALGKFGPAAGKFGAIAAAGAIAQPLVKQFVNDDPSTYLTDPEQQAGMLEALIEGERPRPRSEILDTATTAGALGATAAAIPGTGALYKYRRGLLESKIPKAGPVSEAGLTAGDYLKRHGKGYGVTRAAMGPVMKFISGAYTPAGILATEPLRIAQMRREGESWGEVAKSPTLWMGPAFADTMTKMATAGMKPGSKLARALSLGMSRPMLKTISRRFGMPGLALSLGLSGYDQYQDYKKKRGFFARDEE